MMKRLLLLCIFGCLSGWAETSGSLAFNKPVYLGADSNAFVEQLVEVDYADDKTTGSVLVYGDVAARVRIIIGFNTRHFSFYPSPDGTFFMVTNNFASQQNYGMVYRSRPGDPYLEPVFQTPGDGKSRETWQVAQWQQGNGTVLLTRTVEGGGDDLRAFPLSQRITGKGDVELAPGEQVLLGKKRMFYQLIPELDSNGLPTNRKYLLVGRTDNAWGIVFRNYPVNLTIKYGSKDDSFVLIDNQLPGVEVEYRRTRDYPYFKSSRALQAVPVE